MTQYAYSPMRDPEKSTSSMDQTMERLKARVRESVEKHAERVSINGGSGEPIASVRLPDGKADPLSQSKPSPTPAISWDKPVRTTHDGQGYQRSTDGKFVIAKVKTGTEFKYTASRVNHDFPATCLGGFLAPTDAQACCEAAK